MKHWFVVFTFLLFSKIVFSQSIFADKLTKINGETISCHIKEVGDDEIKYLLEGYRDDVIFGIDKNKVKVIVFSDGRELTFEDSMFGRENYTEQKHNALKVNFLSPLTGATAFSFEHSLKPGRSIESGIGFIGLGQKLDGYKASGVYLSAGYKFIKDPDFYQKGMRYAHILKGSYFKPELAVSIYKYSDHTWIGGDQVADPDTNVAMFGFILNVGKQWVFADRFLVDWYFGAGYGFGNNSNDNARHFAFIGGTSDTPLVLNSGFRIGLLLK